MDRMSALLQQASGMGRAAAPQGVSDIFSMMSGGLAEEPAESGLI